MSVIYHGYGDMPETKYDSFPFINLAESTMKFKKIQLLIQMIDL